MPTQNLTANRRSSQIESDAIENYVQISPKLISYKRKAGQLFVACKSKKSGCWWLQKN